eukprot:gene23403-23433_t
MRVAILAAVLLLAVYTAFGVIKLAKGWTSTPAQVGPAAVAALLAGRVEIGVECSPDCLVTPDKVLPVTQIVSEAVTNAVKYAYQDGCEGKIHVRGRKDGASVVVEIADEGPGLKSGLDPRSGG